MCDHILSAEVAKQQSSYYLASDIPRQTQIGKLYKTKLGLPTIIESGLDTLWKLIQDAKKDIHYDKKCSGVPKSPGI